MWILSENITCGIYFLFLTSSELVHVCTQNQFGGSMYAVCFSVSVLTVTAMLFAMQFSSLFSQWTCQVLARCIRSGSKPVFNNHQAWFWQNMSDPLPGFPLYDSCVLLHMAQIILCKTSPGPIWFWLTVGIWPNRFGAEAGRSARIIWPMLLSWYGSDMNHIQHV